MVKYKENGVDFRMKYDAQGNLTDAVMSTTDRRVSCYKSQMSDSWTIALDKITDGYGELDFRLLRVYRGSYEEMIKYWDKKLAEFNNN